MTIHRRTVLAAGFIAAAARWVPVHNAHAASPDPAALRAAIRGALQAETVFGFERDTADEVLLRATRADSLPDGYRPGDLVAVAGGQLVRALILADTRALITAAADAGLDLYVGSGFRSQAYQVDVFAAQTARWGDEETANRYSARPGHSQHQLGTTIDFTTDFRTFRSSGAADWLRAHAHAFGFVLPYTPAATDRTGYVDEPWHGRWVGRDLAALLQSLDYQTWTDVTADDAVALVRTEAGLSS